MKSKYLVISIASCVLLKCTPFKSSSAPSNGATTAPAQDPPSRPVVVTPPESTQFRDKYTMAVTSENLPVCDKDHESQLIYIKDLQEFKVCNQNLWSSINLQGPKGDVGLPGPKGEPSSLTTLQSAHLVSSITPADGDLDAIPSTSNFSVVFVGQIDGKSVNTQSIKLKNLDTDNAVATTVSYSAVDNIARIIPSLPLDHNTHYEITISNGVKSITGIANNEIKHDFTVDPKISYLADKLGNSTCFVLQNSQTRCLGDNENGQIGFERITGRNLITTPRRLEFGTGRTAKKISIGESHGCAILDDDSLKCFGNAQFGKLGIGVDVVAYFSPQPVDLGSGRTARDVTVGRKHTCVILDNYHLKCFGRQSQGQSYSIVGSVPQIVDLGPGRTAKAVALGANHSCVITDDDNLKCFGENSVGQLGLGDYSFRATAQLVYLGANKTARKISLSDYSSCVVLNDETLKCFGNVYSSTPQNVDLGVGRSAKEVFSGGNHSCILLDNDTVRCLGWNDSGQLGIGDFSGDIILRQPVEFGTGRRVKKLALGSQHSCALLDDDTLKCFGSNEFGQLGLGDFSARSTPTLVH